jgi:hypothetical protein
MRNFVLCSANINHVFKVRFAADQTARFRLSRQKHAPDGSYGRGVDNVVLPSGDFPGVHL